MSCVYDSDAIIHNHFGITMSSEFIPCLLLVRNAAMFHTVHTFKGPFLHSIFMRHMNNQPKWYSGHVGEMVETRL